VSERRWHLVAILGGVTFDALRLRRQDGGGVSFAWRVIEQICEASGIDPAVLRDGPESNVAGLIVRWYAHHLAEGGEPDPVAEQLAAEVRAERGFGGYDA